MSEHKTNPVFYETIPLDHEINLRQLRLNEAKALFDVVEENRIYLGEWLPWANQTQSTADSEQFIEDTLRKRHEGSEYGYGIIASDKLIGHISLMHVSDNKDPEIGYWISKEFSGRGIITKATDAVTKFGFETLDLQKIIIKVEPANMASNKVPEKSGYKLEDNTQSDVNGNAVNIWSKLNPKLL